MYVIKARNAQTMLPQALDRLNREGVKRDSRNGPVTMFPQPCTLHYTHPRERVMFWPERDANPYFHFMESLWMLNGQNDVKTVNTYVKTMKQFSDDGKTFHGAYGHRWRRHFTSEIEGKLYPIDQLKTIAMMLNKNNENRRCYLQMWDATVDLGRQGKDLPCNVGITFQVNYQGELDMVVHNRSNDLVLGALGANVVHMTFLQEVMAAMVGVPVGQHWQVSSNMHCYLEQPSTAKVAPLADRAPDPYRSNTLDDLYGCGKVEPYPIVNGDPDIWFQDLQMLMDEGPITGFRDKFFRRVATPIYRSHQAYRQKDDPDRFVKAMEIIVQCDASDWRQACGEWLLRRDTEAKAKGTL